jgi:hypothetical protein
MIAVVMPWPAVRPFTAQGRIPIPLPSETRLNTGRCAGPQVTETYGVEWLVEKLTDLFRPWLDDGLSEELEFGEIQLWGFVRGAMRRTARMAVDLDVAFGVFGIIGIAYARRAARAWWPKERLLMEEVSCAFQPILTRACAGHLVPQIHIDRLVFLLSRYLDYVGSPWGTDQLREAIDQFIREVPRNLPEDEPPAA